MGKEITMEIKKECGAISDKIRLNLISWNSGSPKYDLRNWYTDKQGNLKYSKGLTMTTEELKALKNLLNTLDI